VILAGIANAADALHGFLVADRAAERIARIRGVDDDAAVAQDFRRKPAQAYLWILRVYLQILTH